MGQTHKTETAKDASKNPLKMQIIQRNAIPSIESIIVDGKNYNLGELHDFHKHPVLSRFIPEQARLSVSWVKLKKDQILECHQHPTPSLIIVCEGEGEVVGDCQQRIHAGDAIVVPPGNKHGFVGRGSNGFWALSIQFEGLGLYEDRDSPRVAFLGEGQIQPSKIAKLLEEQSRLEKNFKKNPLMVLANSTKLNDPAVKERLLEALNCWSDWFQKILAARVAMEHNMDYFDAAEQHLQEEIGHNKMLLEMRHNKPVTLWDPLLDSAASWFLHQMISATDDEKTVLMHLVLEGASTQFHTDAKALVPESGFFDLHSTLDEDHFGMGVKLLEKSKSADVNHLITILQHGWAVFGIIATQMGNYALGKSIKAIPIKGKKS